MKGSIIKRGTRSYRLKYDLPRGPTGERRTAYRTFRGTKTDAEKELRRILAAQDQGVVVDPSRIKVGEYLAGWLEDKAPQTVGAKTLERYEGLVRNQITPHLGNLRLQALRPADVERWLQILIKEGLLSSRSIRHAHGVLRIALEHASRMEMIPRNVAKIIQPPKLEEKEMVILKEDQIDECLTGLADLSIYPIFCVALGTGARRGEIVALKWSDIDLDRGTMNIERSLEQTSAGIRIKPPKTQAGKRTISLPSFTVEALRKHKLTVMETRMAVGAGPLPHNTWVFGDIEGKMPNPYSISDRWRDAVKSRGLPKVTFHALRHTHASMLINAGEDVVKISKRLGHKKPTVTLAIYAHLFKTDDSSIAAAIDEIISENRK